MPVGDVLVCDTRGNIEHDDTALAVDVVAVTETTELLLSRGIPDVEADGAQVGVELERVHLDTEGGDVLLLELTSQVTLDEGGLWQTWSVFALWKYFLHHGVSSWAASRKFLTLPVPPSPTRTSLKVGVFSAMLEVCVCGERGCEL